MFPIRWTAWAGAGVLLAGLLGAAPAGATSFNAPWGDNVAVRLILASGAFGAPVYCYMQKDNPAVFVSGFFQSGDIFNGSNQADVMWETAAPTWWCGGNGNNEALDPSIDVVLRGRGGDDTIVSRGDNFQIEGGSGADLIYAEGGYVLGQGGGDILIGRNTSVVGFLQLFGGNDSDVLCALTGSGLVQGLLGQGGEDHSSGSATVIDVENRDSSTAAWVCPIATFLAATSNPEPGP